MLRLLFLLLPLAFTFHLAAQDTLSHSAYLPQGSVKVAKDYQDNADTRLLTAVYYTIRYPRLALDNSITGAVVIAYSIDTLGRLSVTSSNYLPSEQLGSRPASMHDGDVIYVTAVSRGGKHRSRSKANAEPTKRGKDAMVEEVVRVFESLPDFTPARRDGVIVPDDQVKLVVFDME